MNRVTIELNANGEIGAICSDEPIALYIVSPHTPHDRVYYYNSVQVGPHHVRDQIGGYAVGHAEDGTLSGVSDTISPKLAPSTPTLQLVCSNDSNETSHPVL